METAKTKVLLSSFQKNTDTIGLKYIHSYLSRNGVDSNILFIPKYGKEDFRPIEEFLKDFKPRIIGISLMSQEFNDAKIFSQAVKSVFPEIIIVWGGIHPSINPKECLACADYVFIGESEKAFLEFINAVSKNEPVNNILNLAYKLSSGEVMINHPRPLNENLDEMPFPGHLPEKSFIFHNGKIVKLDRSVFRQHARYSGRLYSLTTTRGCSFSCAYCCNSFFSNLYGALYGPVRVRQRSVDNVIEELRLSFQLYPELIQVNITDDNFLSYDAEWLRDFMEKYKREINKNFACRSTPAHLTDEKASLLRSGGLYLLVMGLQSGSARVNRDIYKRFVSNDRFIESTKIIKRHHLIGKYDVILDNPYETEQDTLETIEVLLKIPKPFLVQAFSLCFYEGTEICSRALKDNLIVEDPLKKNFYKFKPIFLNKIIKITPFFPKRIIGSLVHNRKTYWAKILTDSAYLVSFLFLEPAVWLWTLFKSFDYSVFKTANMIIVFFKTGYSQMFLRK